MILKLFKEAFRQFSYNKPPTKVCQKVSLSCECPYTPREEYPVEGTSYECGGVILEMDRKKNNVRVRWANDYVAEVRLDFLKVISENEFRALLKKGFVADNPNYTFKQKKIMKEEKKKQEWPSSYTLSVDTSNFGGSFNDDF